MKIKRTVKQHFYDRELWPKPVDAGAQEVIGRERMENIIRGTKLNALEFERGFAYAQFRPDEAMKDLREKGKIETFYADYELIEA
jgi:hypothetical protein